MRKFILLLIIIFSFQYTYSQELLTGKITDKQNGQALSNVNVIIPELNTATVSNDLGVYQFNNLPKGTFTVKFSHVGYQTKLVNFQVNKIKNILDIQMPSAPVEVNEVVVLGNTLIEKNQSTYKIESLSNEEIKKSGYLSLVDNLSLLPGISQISNGDAISKPVIRGLYGYRIAPVISGIRFDNQQWQEEHGFGLSDAGISKIEVIEGPASLLYGAQTLGGVINLVDEPNAPVGRTLGNVNLRTFSNTLGAELELGLRGSKENWSWKAFAKGESHADYLDGNDNRVPNTRFAGGNFNGTLGYHNENLVSSLQYIFSYNIDGIVEEGELNNPKEKQEEHFEREFEGPHHTISYHLASLRNSYYIGNTKLKLNLGFQNNHRTEQEGADEQTNNDLGELDIFLNTFSYDAQINHSLGPNTQLTLGTQGYFQKNENEGGRILIPDADINEISFAGYLKQKFNPLLLEGGIRYDSKKINTAEMGIKDSMSYFSKSDLSYNVLNGAVGASLNVAENFTFKLNFATGYRAPDLAELKSNGVHEGTIRYEIGNPTMKSEQNFEEDFGITYNSQNVFVQLSAFNNHINNYIYLSATQDLFKNFQVYRFIQSDVNLRGGEVSVKLRPVNWMDINASYSTVIAKKNDASYVPFMPADKIISGVTFNSGDWKSLKDIFFSLKIRSYLEQKRLGENETKTPGYILLDAGLGTTIYWNKLPIELALNVTNLLDKLYTDHLSLLKPLHVYNMGRNISLSVNVPFALQ